MKCWASWSYTEFQIFIFSLKFHIFTFTAQQLIESRTKLMWHIFDETLEHITEHPHYTNCAIPIHIQIQIQISQINFSHKSNFTGTKSMHSTHYLMQFNTKSNCCSLPSICIEIDVSRKSVSSRFIAPWFDLFASQVITFR